MRRSIGQFEANKTEIKNFMIERLSELSKEAASDHLSFQLCQNLARMSRILNVLLLFQNSPEETIKFEDFSLFKS